MPRCSWQCVLHLPGRMQRPVDISSLGRPSLAAAPQDRTASPLSVGFVVTCV